MSLFYLVLVGGQKLVPISKPIEVLELATKSAIEVNFFVTFSVAIQELMLMDPMEVKVGAKMAAARA